ncbi:MAG: hypothetical protein U0869_07015 [Chloroflexota bacterium]
MDRSAHLQLDPAVAVAANPVSWGVFEKTEGDPLLPGPELVLDQVKQRATPAWSWDPQASSVTGRAVRARLAARRLSLVGAFLPLPPAARNTADDRA